MQIGELIAEPETHRPEEDKCPFCPAEKPNFKSHTDDEEEKYISYGGEKNDSQKLAAIMLAPEKLATLQPNARPKDGVYPNQESKARPKGEALYDDGEERMGKCSCEAHHLISGNQALKNQKFERWIIAAKGTIESDTGYAINNAENGLWAPSIPKKYQAGGWAKLDPDIKYKFARRSMAATGIQFHKGHHSIKDPDDPKQEIHQKYDKYIKNILKDMDRKMVGWARICTCKKQKNELLQPSVRTNRALDNLSEHLREKLCAPREDWDIFLSAHAQRYHKEVCNCMPVINMPTMPTMPTISQL